MSFPLLATLALLGQTPLPAGAPLTVLIAPPDAAGVPSHIVSFAQEHVYEQLKADGLQVVRASELAQGLPPAQRKEVLGCNRLEAACRVMLGEAAVTDVVMIAELVQFLSGYRVGLKAYATSDGELIAEHYVPGVPEDQLLDAFTVASDKVLPVVVRKLRPGSAPRGSQPTAPQVTGPGPGPAPGPVATAPLTPGPTVTERRSGGPGLGWLPAAGGAVLLGVGTVFTLQAGRDYEALSTGEHSDTEALALKASGERKQLYGRAGFALGAAGVLTSGLIYLLSGSSEQDSAVKPTAAVGSTGGMVGIVGTWP